MGLRASQDLRSPSPIMAPDSNENLLNATRSYRLVNIIFLYKWGFHGSECPKMISSLVLC